MNLVDARALRLRIRRGSIALATACVLFGLAARDARADELPTDPLADAALTAAAAAVSVDPMAASTAGISELAAEADAVAAAVEDAVTASTALADAMGVTAATESPADQQQAAVSPAVSTDAPAPDPDPEAASAQPSLAAATESAESLTPVVEPAAQPAEAVAALESPTAPAQPPPADTAEQPPTSPDPQYQAENVAGINSDPTSASQSEPTGAQPAAELSADAGLTWVWTWTWGCGDSAGQSSSAVTPSGAGTTWIWDWRWDCEPNAHSPPPCATCNTNISIRVFSPGDNGAVSQTNSSSATSIANNVTNVIQTATQETVSRAATLPTTPARPWPPPVLLPPVPSFGTVVAPAFASSALSVVTLLPLQLATAAQLPLGFPAETADLSEAIEGEIAAAIAALTGIDGDTGSTPPAVSSSGKSRRAGAAERAAESSQRRSAAAAAVPAFAPSGFSEPATRPAAVHDRGRGATVTRAQPSSRRAPERTPLPRAPFAPGSNLSVASSAPGSGSPGTPLAILVGVLLLVAPHVARWLRVTAAPRPRAAHVRRPERPG